MLSADDNMANSFLEFLNNYFPLLVSYPTPRVCPGAKLFIARLVLNRRLLVAPVDYVRRK